MWHPAETPLVLRTFALPAGSRPQPLSFDLDRIGCEATLLLDNDGDQHVLVREGARSLQLVISGAGALSRVHLWTGAIVHAEQARAHLRALACLNDLCANGRLPPRHFPPDPRGRRLRVVLQALDGSLAGASHREIAVALFGRVRVEADWAHPGNHLRDQVRRAIRRGRDLMNGGYRQFLR